MNFPAMLLSTAFPRVGTKSLSRLSCVVRARARVGVTKFRYIARACCMCLLRPQVWCGRPLCGCGLPIKAKTPAAIPPSPPLLAPHFVRLDDACCTPPDGCLVPDALFNNHRFLVGKAYVYMKRFLSLALAMPKHKKYTKDNFVNDRMWLNRVREPAFLRLLRILCGALSFSRGFRGATGGGGMLVHFNRETPLV